MFLARVFVSPKPTVSDPEGRTIQGGLRQLGFDTVDSVRAGKFFQVRLDEESREEADEKVRLMCDRLLANPIIEGIPVRACPARIRVIRQPAGQDAPYPITPFVLGVSPDSLSSTVSAALIALARLLNAASAQW